MKPLLIAAMTSTLALTTLTSGAALAQSHDTKAPQGQSCGSDHNGNCGTSGQPNAKDTNGKTNSPRGNDNTPGQGNANSGGSHQNGHDTKAQNNTRPSQHKTAAHTGKAGPKYSQGQKIPGHAQSVKNPAKYGLSGKGHYVTKDNYVYRVDPDTQKVLNLVGAVADILK